MHKEFTSLKKKQKNDLTYEIIYDNKALSQLQKLPKEVSARILNKLDDTKKYPFRHFERLKTSSLYKLRIGQYRAIADIQSKLILITVLEIDYRRRVYKKRRCPKKRKLLHYSLALRHGLWSETNKLSENSLNFQN